MTTVKVSITEGRQCDKKTVFQHYGMKQLPVHYYSLRGTMTHAIINITLNRILTNQPVTESFFAAENSDWVFPTLTDTRKGERIVLEPHYNKILPECLEGGKKFYEWLTAATWNDSTNRMIVSEGVIKMEETLGVSMSGPDDLDILVEGTPDFFSQEFLVDFKAGKRSWKKGGDNNYREQLAGYLWLIQSTYGWKPKPLILYLGEKSVLVDQMERDELIKKHLPKLKANLKKKADLKYRLTQEGSTLGVDDIPPERDFLCSMCEYTHLCRGY